MRGLTLPFCLMKIYGPISVDLREKRKFFFFSFLSLSLLSLSLSASPPLRFSLFSFYLTFFFLFLIIIFSCLSFSLFPPLNTYLNVNHSHKCTTCHAMCHPTPDALKNVKFQLYQNSMKFDRLTRFQQVN